MDQIWERYELACIEPEGCEVLDYVLRTIVWSFVGLSFLVFFIAVRAWTKNLHPIPGTALAFAIAAVIVRLGRNYLGSTGNLRNITILFGLGLAAAWIGRPAFTERAPAPERASPTEASPAVTSPTESVSEASSRPSATN